jgi:glycosyltransferase involved in cell wall biosynthesis
MMRTKYLLVTDSVFLAEAAFVKRIRGKGITVIQFCHELQIDDCPTTCRRAGIYARYARVPDFVIDVDPFRAEVRREHFRLVQKPYVLLNTLPRKALPKKEGRGRLSALAGGCDFCGRPVVVFTGGVGKEKPFERVIDAIAQSGTNVFFVAFLTVDAGKISQLTQYAKERLSEGHYRICPAVTRTEILSAIWEADIGVVDYTYSVEPTLNQKYCAPTKLYEYMASGLAVLGSNNDSLRRVIEGEGIGVCAQDDSVQSLAQGLKRLVANPALLCEMKLRAASCFATKYSWEEVCSPVVEQILEEVGVPRSTHTMTNVNT